MTEIATHPGITSQKSIGERKCEIKVDRAKDRHFHFEKLLALVGSITNEQEIVKKWRRSFLLRQELSNTAEW